MIIPKSQLITVNVKKEQQNINFQYKKVELPKYAYIVTIDEVYEGFENFTTKKVDYEIKDIDIEYMKEAKLDLTYAEFEKCIDAFEKIQKMKKSPALKTIQENWDALANAQLYSKLTPEIRARIYNEFWKPLREENKNKSFLRMFWEKAEHDDKNPNAAFHHRKTFEKMTLRKQQKVDLETYRKFYDFRDQQFKVLDLLKDIFIRE